MFVTKKRYDVACAHAEYSAKVSRDLAEKLERVSANLANSEERLRITNRSFRAMTQHAAELQAELDGIKSKRLANLTNANAKRRAAKERA